MSARTEQSRDLRSLKGNEPLALAAPDTAWIVEAGVVALFSVETGRSDGRRRFLCRLDPGDILLTGISGVPAPFGLNAVAIEDARLQVMPIRAVTARAIEGDSAAILQIESWIRRTASILSAAGRPETPVVFPADSLDAGQAWEPESPDVSFLAVRSGNLHLFGSCDHTIEASSAPLPIAEGIWFQAANPAQVAPFSIREFRSAAELEGSLFELQRLFHHFVPSIEVQRQLSEGRRLDHKRRLTENVSAKVLAELAQVLQSVEDRPLSTEGQPLLAAIRAVGEAQRTPIRPPAETDRRSDPLQAIAQASGLRTRRVILSGKWWITENGALLGYLRDTEQPVALLPVKPRLFRAAAGYEIFNPVDGTRTTVDARSASALSSSGVTFYRPLKDSVTSLDVLKFSLQGRYKDVLVIAFSGVAATLLGMLTPQATSVLVENAIPDANRSMVLQIGLGLLAAAVGSLLFEFAQALSMIRMEIGSSSVLQSGVWDKLLKLSPDFFRKFTAGDLASRAGGINRIRQQLSGATLRSIFMGLTSLLNLALMFYYSPTLAVASIGVAVLAVILTGWAGVAVTRLQRELQEKDGHLFGALVQLINGAGKLRVAGAEPRAFAYWGHLYSQQQKIRFNIQRVQDYLRLFGSVLPPLSSALIFGIVAELLLSGPSTFLLGTFLAFNAAFGLFLAGVTTLSDTGVGLLSVVTLWERAKVILTSEPEVDSSKSHPGKLRGRVSVQHVTFRYRSDGPLILEDVSIEAAPGESIALVGPSGSGKSTILNLLLRFETPLSGGIYFDGQDLNGLDVNAVRRQIGVVLQDNKIMSGSIYENIVCGSLCTLQDAWDAAKAAAFAEDVEKMPIGMHTPISEGGSNISGGQRQRLLIARALVTKPSILIFDEATSALDNRTQAIVTESLHGLKVTSIIVAHRLSTIRHADRIYVIEAGRVVQCGSFDELARQEGLFARLMARQMI